MSKYEVISGPYFSVFGLNSERYGVIHLKLIKNGARWSKVGISYELWRIIKKVTSKVKCQKYKVDVRN